MNQAAFPDTEPMPLSEEQAPQAFRANPDRVRVRLSSILAEVRAASTLPWDARRLRLYCAIFPQMSHWLPEEEAAQFRLEFDSEIARLERSEAA